MQYHIEYYKEGNLIFQRGEKSHFVTNDLQVLKDTIMECVNLKYSISKLYQNEDEGYPITGRERIMKAYKVYNYRGRHVTLSFHPLGDALMDEIEVEAAKGFTIKESNFGGRYLEETATKIPYNISTASINDHGAIMAPEYKLYYGAPKQTGRWKVIAKVVG